MWNEKEMKRIFDEPSLTVDEAIRIAFDKGATVAEIAEFLCRTKETIRASLKRSRIMLTRKEKGTSDEREEANAPH